MPKNLDKICRSRITYLVAECRFISLELQYNWSAISGMDLRILKLITVHTYIILLDHDYLILTAIVTITMMTMSILNVIILAVIGEANFHPKA